MKQPSPPPQGKKVAVSISPVMRLILGLCVLGFLVPLLFGNWMRWQGAKEADWMAFYIAIAGTATGVFFSLALTLWAVTRTKTDIRDEGRKGRYLNVLEVLGRAISTGVGIYKDVAPRAVRPAETPKSAAGRQASPTVESPKP